MVYVDGFNLYYGLKSKGWRRFYWLDVRELSEKLLRAGQRLVGVRYFTARITGNQQEKNVAKQLTWKRLKRAGILRSTMATISRSRANAINADRVGPYTKKK